LIFFVFLFFFLFLLVILERCIEIYGLDGNHQVKHEKGTKYDCYHEEDIICHCTCSFPDLIHDVCPSLQCDDDKDVEDGFKYVIEGGDTLVGVAIFLAPVAIDDVAMCIFLAHVLITIFVGLNESILSDASVDQDPFKELIAHSSKHDQEEDEENQDIEQCWQGIQKRLHKFPHAGHGVNCSQGSQDTDDSDS
jgi:hypothetical protein